MILKRWNVNLYEVKCHSHLNPAQLQDKLKELGIVIIEWNVKSAEIKETIEVK